VYDVIGIGFGPANLALGVALEEAEERGDGLRRLFLEARAEQCWHPGMLIENSLIQITVLKDLVLPVNPRSRFTFLNYLKEKGRLFQFLNLRDLFPSRTEFNDYLCWVAAQLSGHVRYHRRVASVRPVERGGEVDLLEVVAVDGGTGAEERYLARNVVVATGGRPWVPPQLGIRAEEGTDRVFHSHQFMTRMDGAFPDRKGRHRFVVVGSGQSGAELFHTLLNRYPNADVTATVRGFGYKPADESDFVNEVFLPEMVDFFYDLPSGRQTEVIDSFRDVNYSVVDHALIKRIYRALYDERVTGKERARVLPYQQLVAVEEAATSVRARFRDLIRGHERTLECDGLVLCTGYRWDQQHPLLNELAPWLGTDESGGYRVLRDYRLEGRAGFAPGVYLQGYCEATHGISETVLSLLPVRAQDVLRSLLARRADGSDLPVPAAAGADG
jgi:L-ornithine N5-oxygenase